MKKPNFLLLLAIMGFSFNSIAQFSFGPKIGMNFSKIAYDYKNTNYEPVTRFLVTPSFGFMVHYQINDPIGIRAGLSFSRKGTGIDVEKTYNYLDTLGYVREGWQRYSYNYFEIPIEGTFGINLGESYIFANVGPYFGLFLGGRNRYNYDKYLENPDGSWTLIDNYEDIIKIKARREVTSIDLEEEYQYLRGIDVGFNFGIGYRIKMFMVNVQYGLGLINLTPEYTFDSDYQNDYKKYNRVISVNFAVLFGGKKKE